MISTLRVSIVAMSCALAVASFAPFEMVHAHQDHSTEAKRPIRSAKASQTAAVLRDLWLGHIFWVRNVALATLNKDDAAARAAEQQAVANAQSIAAAIEPFYGAAAKGSRAIMAL